MKAGRFKIFSLLALVFALLLLVSGSAFAGHNEHSKDGKGGDKKAESAASQEESGDEVPDDNDDNAHPSGKDRETNNGDTDDEQGKSGSNPDNDGHGPERNSCEGSGVGECVDKPGGDGGVDQADQDGNNGCGNDDDFEDDNEGWCGKPPKTDNDTEVGGDVVVTEPKVELPKVTVKKDKVLGTRIQRKPSATAAPARVRAAAAPAVLGVRAARGAALPFTGGDVVVFLGIAIALVAGGLVITRMPKDES